MLFDSEEIAGIPYDDEVLLDPKKLKKLLRREIYWTLV
jgi:hypothetical protein